MNRYSAEPCRRVALRAKPQCGRIGGRFTTPGRREANDRRRSRGISLGRDAARRRFQEQDQLKCVDPLSGELLWARTDIPAGCELFGDMEYVFAADVGGRVAHVIRMVDGRLVGKRELPKQEWLMTVGRNVAEVGFKMNRESRLLSIRVSDLFSGEVLYEHEFPIASRVSVMEPDAIAIYEPTGKFRVDRRAHRRSRPSTRSSSRSPTCTAFTRCKRATSCS